MWRLRITWHSVGIPSTLFVARLLLDAAAAIKLTHHSHPSALGTATP